MIANAKRLLPEAIGFVVLQVAISKYPAMLAGTVPTFSSQELIYIIIMSGVAAVLTENVIYRLNGLRRNSDSRDKRR